MLLITTSDQSRLEKNKEILFLGTWCVKEKYKSLWSKLDYQILNHHWDDPYQMEKDSRKIDDIYEKILDQLVLWLNNYHSLDWTNREWRIVIGPWLHKFIEISFDRWRSIESSNEKFDIKETVIANVNLEDIYTKSFSDLSKKSKTKDWNRNFYDLIIKYLDRIPYRIDNDTKYKRKDFDNKKLKIKNFSFFCLKKVIKFRLLMPLLNILKKNDQIAIVDSYLNLKNIITLKIIFRSFPLGDYTPFKYFSLSNKDSLKRNEINLKLNTLNQYEKFIADIIPRIIPSIYIEDLKKILNFSNKIALPKSPKLIITAVSIWHDEIFKIWAAKNINKGSKLAILQHGGDYGYALVTPFEKHEEKISEQYFVWGWGKKDSNMINIPVHIVNKKDEAKFNQKGNITIVTNFLNENKYLSQIHSSWLHAKRSKRYTDNISGLIKSLYGEVKAKMILRKFPLDNSIPKNINQLLNQKKISLSNIKNMSIELNSSKITIFTYSSTPFLESMVLDRPCLLFYDEFLEPIREDAKEYFNFLIEVNIIHITIDSLKNHLVNIEDGIEKWWNNNLVVDAKNLFCEKFARKKGSIIKTIKKNNSF